MKHTIGYILAKPRDFKLCLKCGQINWYENEECVFCGASDFKKATRKDVEIFIKLIKGEAEHICDECEIEV
jgi:hypothetical protein